jgi:large subunit ribosomal protein L10
MAITKAKKSELIEKFDRILSDAATTVFVKFKGITVADTTLMRRALRDAGIGYTVVKKTLLERVLKARGYKGDLPALPGEVAMVYGKDAVAPAREIAVFAKKYGENLSLLGGIFEGTFRDKAGIVTIASIPSLQVLYGQFANVINSPIQGLAVALNEVAKKKGN